MHPACGLEAQGKGCSPGAVGVCVGGDRTSGYTHAKEQLFRTLDDVNPDPRLREVEASVMATVNTLEIGTMGFGGKVTLIGCKIGALNRLPASFFVSVAYDCWAFRRLGVVLNASTGAIERWLYRDPSHPIIPMLDQSGFMRTGRAVTVKTPLTDDAVRALQVGDVVLVSGRMFTGRDAVHAHLMKHEPPVDLRGSVLYHCGPVVAKDGESWRVTAAGPTTSIREEPYQGEIIKRYGVRAVIGKGGMGAKTLAAMKEHGAVYLNAIGGAAQFYARAIKKVDGVSLLEFGTPEAMWHLTVDEFPAIVTMDAHGNSLHKDIEQESGAAPGSPSACDSTRSIVRTALEPAQSKFVNRTVTSTSRSSTSPESAIQLTDSRKRPLRARGPRCSLAGPELLQSGPRVTVLHRGHVEIRGFDVRDRQQRKRRQLRHVDRLQVARRTSCTPRRGDLCAPRPARR